MNWFILIVSLFLAFGNYKAGTRLGDVITGFLLGVAALMILLILRVG